MAGAIELDVDGTPVRLTSPDKEMFPGITKREVADYALAVGPGLLLALRDRPVTMERWPQGWSAEAKISTRQDNSGDAFYQKKAPTKGRPEFVQVATVTYPSGRTAEQVAPHDLATILWMINLNTVRFHAWPVRLPDTDGVDLLRIDLDPQPGTEFADAVFAAHRLRPIMTDLGLTPFIKTSGGRGLHVYAPIQPCDFIDARHATIAIGRALGRELPDKVTTSWWKEERGERIFVDFNQAARDRLMTSAYSIRPGANAQVSMPLSWDELDDVTPDMFTVKTAPARFAERGDAWADLETTTPASVTPALAWYERDAAAGEGEMPYPPEYPKMPGEPPRVQPSKKNAANWA